MTPGSKGRIREPGASRATGRHPDRLREYRDRRVATRTTEPGSPATPVKVTRSVESRFFVVQEHHALHWDFRLQHERVLASWALPKGLPCSPSENHLAVRTEDHPREYASTRARSPAESMEQGV